MPLSRASRWLGATYFHFYNRERPHQGSLSTIVRLPNYGKRKPMLLLSFHLIFVTFLVLTVDTTIDDLGLAGASNVWMMPACTMTTRRDSGRFNETFKGKRGIFALRILRLLRLVHPHFFQFLYVYDFITCRFIIVTLYLLPALNRSRSLHYGDCHLQPGFATKA